MSLYTDFRVSLRVAIRARFLPTSFWLAVFTVGSAWLAGQFSGRQPATVSLDVGLSAIRIVLPILAILLLYELLSREFEKKYCLLSLTYPRSRAAFLAGRVLAVLGLLCLLLIGLAVLLVATSAWIGQGYNQDTPPALGLPYVVTVSFIALDMLAVVAVGTLLAVVASTPSMLLIGTLGFTLIARSYSGIVALLQRDSTLVSGADVYQSSLSFIGFLVPDLGALDVRMVALYGTYSFLPADWQLRSMAVVVYAIAGFSLSVWFLGRKRFS